MFDVIEMEELEPGVFGCLIATMGLELGMVEVGAAVTAEQAAIIADVAKSVGIADPRWLTAVMDHESNIRTDIQNASSKATGLIQFLGSTAANLLGMNPKDKTQQAAALERVKAMAFREQMELVRKYLMPYKGRYRTGLDVALAVFYPRAMGNMGHVIARKGEKAYDWNKALDKDGKGFIVPTDYARSLFKFGLRHGVSMSPVDSYLEKTRSARTLGDLFQVINTIRAENPSQPPHAWERLQKSIAKDINKLGYTHSAVVPLDGGGSIDFRESLTAQIRGAFGVQSEYTVARYVMDKPLEAAKGVIETTATTVEKGVEAAADIASSPGKMAAIAGGGIVGLLLLRKVFGL